MDFETALECCPIIAILRDLEPSEALPVGQALVGAGVTLIEVPLDAPDPMRSITTLVECFGEQALIGGGLVTTPDQVDALADASARLVVSPHTDPALIARARARGLVPLPGVLTPTEAFRALRAGAVALQLFPAQATRPQALAAMRSVLPPGTAVLPVGGITPDKMGHWWAAGARGFGLGGTLYRPGRSARDVAERARACIAAIKGPLPAP